MRSLQAFPLGVRALIPVAPVVAALVLVAGVARAQVVRVALSESSSGSPLPGAIVRLLRDTTDVARALTDETGTAVLRAPRPGTYRIRVNRIGYRAMLTDPFALEPLQTLSRDLSMTSVPIVLPQVVVRSASRCGAQMEAGSLAATLWDEIRNALTANVLTHNVWAVPLHVQEFQRDVDRDGAIVHEVMVSSRISRGPPFAALAAESLATRGFVFDSGNNETTFAAPDASLLLSDVFVRTHCFRAVAGAGELVGLEFEPVPGRRTTDVRGTMWVDRATSKLQSLDFTYTGLPQDLRRADLGGRVEFRRIPTGAWIVSYWHVRMPKLELQKGEFRLGHFGQGLPRAISPDIRRVIGYVDHGGRVDVAAKTGTVVARALIAGVVFDSTTGTGLANVKVSIHGTPDSAFSDADGRFRFTTAHGGERTIVATHPKLGVLDDGSYRRVTLSLGDSTTLDFAVPSMTRFVREFCGVSRSRAGVVGIARDEVGVPAEGLEIRVQWESNVGAVREERATSGPGGIYALCDLPPGLTLAVRLHRGGEARLQQMGRHGVRLPGGAALVEETVRLNTGEYRWLELKPPAGDR